MSTPLPELERRYRLALEVFLELGGENALQKAYEVGREVIAAGMGVLELTTMHGTVLADLLSRVPAKRAAAIVLGSMNFLNESLSPFEMPLRGFRENNEKLRRLAFLAEASNMLAESLDCGQTLRRVAESAVPFLADWCLVHIMDVDGLVRCMAVAQADPNKSDLARRLEEQTLPIVPGWVSRSFLMGKSEILTDRTYNWLEPATHGDAPLPVASSALVTPLLARGQAVGVLVFLSVESERHFNSSDQVLADDLAYRCALAIDNARMHGEAIRQRDAAEKAIHTKDEFLAHLRHDLRNPLAPILGWVRILKNQSPIMSDALLAEGVSTLERNARSIQQLLDDHLDAGSTAPVEPLPTNGPIRVLLIEDARDVMILMKKELEWAGFTVYTAQDGRAGLELARLEVPDVIVSDIRMPGMDGYQFLKELRDIPTLDSIPAIALTGFGAERDIQEARTAGYAEHMVKPVDLARLSASITRLTRRSAS